jgi:hypothetical protein
VLLRDRILLLPFFSRYADVEPPSSLEMVLGLGTKGSRGAAPRT